MCYPGLPNEVSLQDAYWQFTCHLLYKDKSDNGEFNKYETMQTGNLTEALRLDLDLLQSILKWCNHYDDWAILVNQSKQVSHCNVTLIVLGND